ncbi:uncharacterized protein LOC131613191 [Vicia villosa]|uniref:uncharacterized protein LOC131613191 n=1 Tax=Vicia villosa TaxID=3911 RepID=UPI00273CB6D6|nr:uncharacterized protein LOC131613191 [Vicia villosa]
MDEIRRAYLKWGPCQIQLEQYPLSGKEDHKRRFQYAWFSLFPSWLEYSPLEDASYCLPCHLFSKRPSGRPGSDVFISTACAFRGHDESKESLNQGNFLQLIKLLACYNDIAKVVLENAPSNRKYTSHHIQKEILHILLRRVKKHIREEIGDSKFYILVDEARDESKKEQMSLQKVCDILSLHNLDVSNIRGQGYDGANNMRGEWNDLQALSMKDCAYAYHVHYFTHRLQLALVTAAREVKSIHQFFDKITLIVNSVCSSTKRHDELQASQLEEIEHLLEIGEIVTGRGENQIGTLRRAGDTRWGSRFSSISNLINMYEATCIISRKFAKEGLNYASRGDADSAYNHLKSIDFIFILHLMKEIMSVTNMLCQALQQQSQDVVNAMHLVCTTKTLIQELREDGLDKLFTYVKSFCEKHDIEIPDLDDVHSTTRFGRSRLEENQDNYRAFNFDTICTLVEKYYPMVFNEQERINL